MKKLIVMLLAVMLVLSFTACGFKSDIKPLDVSKGDKMSEQDVEDFSARLEKIAEEEGSFIEGQWYSIKMDVISESEMDDIEMSMKIKLSGKYYMSSIAYDVKYKLVAEAVMEGVDENGDDISGKASFTVTHLKGKTFTKATEKTKEKDGTSSSTDYSVSNESAGSGIEGFNDILDMLSGLFEFDFDMVGSGEPEYYECGKYGVGTFTESENEYGESIAEMKFEFVKNSILLKEMAMYTYSKTNYEGIKAESEMRFTMKKCASGSVKAPKDEYLYEERY